MMPPTSTEQHESSDNYTHEICRAAGAHGCFRVIVCHEGVQWILQGRQRAKRSASVARWKAVAYVTSRETLERLWAAKIGCRAPEIRELPPKLVRRR